MRRAFDSDDEKEEEDIGEEDGEDQYRILEISESISYNAFIKKEEEEKQKKAIEVRNELLKAVMIL